eukprot:3951911-Prymnesium_polylepis.1
MEAATRAARRRAWPLPSLQRACELARPPGEAAAARRPNDVSRHGRGRHAPRRLRRRPGRPELAPTREQRQDPIVDEPAQLLQPPRARHPHPLE